MTHCPFSVIAKAGTVIEKSHLMDTLPVVWELLLDEDQQLVSSAGKVLNTDQNDAVLFAEEVAEEIQDLFLFTSFRVS